jgi:3-oxoacyl-[acyl-carrier protein] reductase
MKEKTMETFHEKVAIITGGGRGIGAATARLLAARGANVIVNYVSNTAAAEQVVAAIRAQGGQARAVQADIQEQEACAFLVQQTLQTFGRIDILVHSAAPHSVLKPFAALNTWDEFALRITGELKGGFEITKAVIPHMQKQHYGRIVYVGAGVARTPMPLFISVGVAKAGLNTFAKYLAQEYGPDGITVNVVEPGMVMTELSAAHMPEQTRQGILAVTPLGRIAEPEDIARSIAFFAGDDSGFMTGIVAPVNGGMMMD